MPKTVVSFKSLFQMLSRQYVNIRYFLKSNRALMGLFFLIIIELFVFYGLNGQPNDGYADYVANTRSAYLNVFSFIFFGNLKSATIMVLAGIIPFFLGSIFISVLTIKGLVTTFKFLVFVENIPLHTLLLSILPHGIFEMTALLFSAVLSYIVSKEITLSMVKQIRKKDIAFRGRIYSPAGIKQTFYMVVKCWLLVSLPLILVAALIESFISVLIVEALL